MTISFQKKWTFWQRFKREVVFFGLPMICLELVGAPLWGWATVLSLVVPGTLLGLLAYSAIEHLLISSLAK